MARSYIPHSNPIKTKHNCFSPLRILCGKSTDSFRLAATQTTSVTMQAFANITFMLGTMMALLATVTKDLNQKT